MKKIICLVLVFVLALAVVACTPNDEQDSSTAASSTSSSSSSSTIGSNPIVPDADVMTWEEYIAAELDTEVIIEAYVQAKQAWWFDDSVGHGKGTFYLQDEDGGYFLYELNCTEDEYNALTVGTKVRVTGYKAEWSGEIEIIDATVEILEGNFIATPVDVTALLGKDELVNYQNMLVEFKGLTVVSFTYSKGYVGSDLEVKLTLDGAEYTFYVESYLTNSDTEVYKAVEALKAGDVIDVVGFAYWYNGINTHITSVTVK